MPGGPMGLGSGGDAGPSEAELAAMLAQMREAPVEQVLVEVVNALLQAVQVKLGRPDARLILDAVAAVATVADGRVDPALLGQVQQAVTQLRLAQVDAEGVPAGDTSAAVNEPVMRAPEAPRASQVPQAPPEGGGASRLWVPGR